MALAWLPALCDEADAEPRFLGCEDFGEQGARPADDARSASGRMAGHPDLGVRADRQKAGGDGGAIAAGFGLKAGKSLLRSGLWGLKELQGYSFGDRGTKRWMTLIFSSLSSEVEGSANMAGLCSSV